MNDEQVHSEHTDVAAYALGLLEARDRQAFEKHLAGCPACAAELAEMSGMKGLLSDLGPDAAPVDEPSQAQVADLVRRRARSQRRYARRQVLLAAAAAVVLLAGGVGVGLATESRAAPGAPVSPFAGQQVLRSVTSAQTGVHAKVGLAARPWGTLVTLELSHVKGPVECQLIAVSRTGAHRFIGNWLVGRPTAGTPGRPVPLVVHQGDTAFKIGSLSQIDIAVMGGQTLVAVPV